MIQLLRERKWQFLSGILALALFYELGPALPYQVAQSFGIRTPLTQFYRLQVCNGLSYNVAVDMFNLNDLTIKEFGVQQSVNQIRAGSYPRKSIHLVPGEKRYIYTPYVIDPAIGYVLLVARTSVEYIDDEDCNQKLGVYLFPAMNIHMGKRTLVLEENDMFSVKGSMIGSPEKHLGDFKVIKMLRPDERLTTD